MRAEEPGEDDLSRFYRMTHEQEPYETYEQKIIGLKNIFESFKEGIDHEDVYTIPQKRFDDIGRRPFLYWFGEDILQLFDVYPPLEDRAEVLRGLDTGDDERFVRMVWEVPEDEERWQPYALKDSEIPYYRPAKYLVDWGNDGGISDHLMVASFQVRNISPKVGYRSADGGIT
jgi:hypothetical protein